MKNWKELKEALRKHIIDNPEKVREELQELKKKSTQGGWMKQLNI